MSKNKDISQTQKMLDEIILLFGQKKKEFPRKTFLLSFFAVCPGHDINFA